MTRKSYFPLIALCMATAVHAQSSSPFTVEGKIPGLTAGCEVKLINVEYGQRQTIATAKSTDGGFRLKSSVKSPTLCWLDIKDTNGDMGKQLDLMVESGNMTVTAAHVDSLPPSFTFTTEKLCKECNVDFAGSETLQEFKEYRTAMLPFEIAAKQIHYKLYHATDAYNRDKTLNDSLQALLHDADRKTETARLDFITRHPDYAISAYLWCERLREPFSFTNDELDHLLELTKDNRDTARLVELQKAVQESRKFVKGLKYTDIDVSDTDKNNHRLSDYMHAGKYAFFDFWASWCGPCRAAIPHVRDLYKQYSDRMDICSVSLDNKEADWRRAMEEEKMEWTQLWLPKEKQKAATAAYSIHGIPFLLLLSPEGEILYAGNSASEASATLMQHIDKASER